MRQDERVAPSPLSAAARATHHHVLGHGTQLLSLLLYPLPTTWQHSPSQNKNLNCRIYQRRTYGAIRGSPDHDFEADEGEIELSGASAPLIRSERQPSAFSLGVKSKTKIAGHLSRCPDDNGITVCPAVFRASSR